ncbi:MAG: hypothetical protein OXF27_09395 [Acidobacteria bacterium]|nr:hypothetical protein [Acidobacteriota bacterium]
MSGWNLSRAKISLFVSLVLAIGGSLTACGGGGEEQSLISSFFRASRFNDRATLGGVSMVAFNPDTDGTVGSFDIESITEEQRRPLRMREMAAALAQAQQDQRTFAAEMKAYQDENLDAIARVIEAERADEDVRSRDQDVQEAWTKWREDSQGHSRAVADAETDLAAESSVASVSAYDPNNPIDVQSLEGELLTKEVTITAAVEQGGSEEDRTMVITLQRVELNVADGMIEGRWIITAIDS